MTTRAQLDTLLRKIEKGARIFLKVEIFVEASAGVLFVAGGVLFGGGWAFLLKRAGDFVEAEIVFVGAGAGFLLR